MEVIQIYILFATLLLLYLLIGYAVAYSYVKTASEETLSYRKYINATIMFLFWAPAILIVFVWIVIQDTLDEV